MNTDSASSPKSSAGQELIRGEHVLLRQWLREAPADWTTESERPYETVGYVLEGRFELDVAGNVRSFGTGDVYRVPRGATHRYHVLEALTAIEATSPPAPEPKA